MKKLCFILSCLIGLSVSAAKPPQDCNPLLFSPKSLYNVVSGGWQENDCTFIGFSLFVSLIGFSLIMTSRRYLREKREWNSGYCKCGLKWDFYNTSDGYRFVCYRCNVNLRTTHHFHKEVK